MRVIITMFMLCNMINWDEGVSSVVASSSVGEDTNGGEGVLYYT